MHDFKQYESLPEVAKDYFSYLAAYLFNSNSRHAYKCRYVDNTGNQDKYFVGVLNSPYAEMEFIFEMKYWDTFLVPEHDEVKRMNPELNLPYDEALKNIALYLHKF